MEFINKSSNLHRMCMIVQTYTYAEFAQSTRECSNEGFASAISQPSYTYDPMCIDDMAFLCDSDDECITDADMEEVYM